MKKRLFAVLTAVFLLCACLPLSVSAASGDQFIYKQFTYTVIDEEITILTCTPSASGHIEIPATIGGYPVTAIAENAFYGCGSITGFTIPDSVTSIGVDALLGTAFFATASNWEDGVLYSGKHLIAAALELAGKYTVRADTLVIADQAFRNCTALTKVTIPGSVKSVGSYAFAGCTALEKVKLRDGVATIRNGAFMKCDKLTEITIPDSVTTLGEWAFKGCTSLETATVGGGITNMGIAVFDDCTSLASVTIREGCTTIQNHTFNGCRSLTYVVVPATVKTIGYSAFASCDSLQDVYFRGSKEDWSTVTIAAGNDALAKAQWHDKSALTPIQKQWLLVGIAAVAVIAIAVTVLVTLKKKKKAKKSKK